MDKPSASLTSWHNERGLELTGNESVLEIGTGSGYQCAVLCELSRWVISVERHPELSARAGAALQTLSYNNYTLVVGDGTYGWREFVPYDRIIVTAASQRCRKYCSISLPKGELWSFLSARAKRNSSRRFAKLRVNQSFANFPAAGLSRWSAARAALVKKILSFDNTAAVYD